MFRMKSIFAAALLCATTAPALAGQSVTDPQFVNLVPAPKGTIQASAEGAAATQTATIPAVVGQTAYVCKVTFTASGSTAALVVTPTVTGLLGGTLTGVYTFPIGVGVPAAPLTYDFNDNGGCLPASAANVAISAILPSGGSGNAAASAVIIGYYR